MKKGIELICNDKRYVVKDHIADGAFGTVWNARSPEGVDVAIKFLSISSGYRQDVAVRFRQEAEKMADLEHPHIVRVYGSGNIDQFDDAGNRMPFQRPYYVMEKMDASLAAVIRDCVPLSINNVCGIVDEIAAGLDYSYRRKVKAHADLHPGNILFDAESLDAKIADFGMMLLEPEDIMTLSTTAKTVDSSLEDKSRLISRYAAPEVLRGGRQFASVRSDIYSLGVILEDILLICKDTENKKGMLSISDKATINSPEKRFGSIFEFRYALREVLGIDRISKLKDYRVREWVKANPKLMRDVELDDSIFKILKNARMDGREKQVEAAVREMFKDYNIRGKTDVWVEKFKGIVLHAPEERQVELIGAFFDDLLTKAEIVDDDDDDRIFDLNRREVIQGLVSLAYLGVIGGAIYWGVKSCNCGDEEVKAKYKSVRPDNISRKK
ncbi:serine/threonine protein kinase [Nanoarchaeota archaeon]